MIFTVPEMEMLCFFYRGTRKATLAMLKQAAAEMGAGLEQKRVIAQSAACKLEQMKVGDLASIVFDD